MENDVSSAPWNFSRWTAPRSLVTATCALAPGVNGINTTNSSPPNRAGVSSVRRECRSSWPNPRNTSSPTR